jgi:hypothetical protein
MALLPRDVPITRAQVQEWIDLWQRTSNESRPRLGEYIRGQIDALDLPDAVVVTQAHDYLGEETPVVDMILDDLPSYGVSADDS